MSDWSQMSMLTDALNEVFIGADKSNYFLNVNINNPPTPPQKA